MSFIDEIKSKVTGALGSNTQAADMVNHAIDMVSQNGIGGLQGMIDQFKAKGLGDVVNSWVGTGKNLPITAAQIQSVLGNEKVKAMAAKMGISPDQVAAGLSSVLPHIVDKLSPNGQLPADGNALSQAMGAIKKATA